MKFTNGNEMKIPQKRIKKIVRNLAGKR